jgi:4-amino-4-deoxychorismate lyase
MSNVPSSTAIATWVDGIEGNLVPADDRGLQYGDGVFETILVRNGVPRFLAAHRERLVLGLATLGIQFRGGDDLQQEIARAAAAAPPLAILKIVVTRGSAPRRGYAPADNSTARRIVSLWATEQLAKDLSDEGVVLGLARMRLAEPSPFAGL